MAEKLPRIKFAPRPAWQLDRLADWIEEWNLELRLRNARIGHMQREAPDPVRQHSEPVKALVRDFDHPASVGEIRVLSPVLTPNIERPVFVAVFGDWDEGEVLVAPFSPFSVPATPGEWLTGRSNPVLKVLEIWNARSVPKAALDQSWLVDELTDSECESAWCIFEHDAFGATLPHQFEQDLGAPLIHPNDPRRRYQDEEMAMLVNFQALAEKLPTAIAATPKIPLNQIDFIPELEDWESCQPALAAATDKMPQLEKVFIAPEQNLCVSFTPAWEEKICATVFNREGEKSTMLDGASIVAPDGIVLGTFSNGRTQVPRRALGNGFHISLPEGRIVQLLSEDERAPD